MVEKISRRTAIRSLLFGTGVLGALAITESVRRLHRDSSLAWLTSPDAYHFQIAGMLPPADLCGTYINAPFLYLASEEALEHRLEAIDKPWIRGVRVFLNDTYEEQLGVYNTHVLNRLTNFARQLEAKNKKIQVDLFDGYTMQKTWNPIFGGHDATSPYACEGRNLFYTHKVLVDAFLYRLDSVLPSLCQLPNLAAVSVANELHPPDGALGTEQFRLWYLRVIAAIQDRLPDIPTLSGVGDPRELGDIPGLAATTVHVYPGMDTLRWISDYILSSSTPMLVQECGSPHSLHNIHSPIPNDIQLSDYLKDILYKMSVVDPATHTVTLHTTSLYPWKVDAYDDGFFFNPEIDTQTSDLLSTFSAIVDQLVI